jgi:hypothetical protein
VKIIKIPWKGMEYFCLILKTVQRTLGVLMMFFWVWDRVDWLVEASVLEKCTVSIFRAEVTMLGIRGII